MSILIDKNTRVVFQGITGSEGSFHARQCMEYGTSVVAGVTPERWELFQEKAPIFNRVIDAKEKEGANAACIFVPPAFAADAIIEAIDAGLDLVVCITEGIPVLDMVKVKKYLAGKRPGPSVPTARALTPPGKCKIGIMPGFIHREGSIGLISRSGTLTYEVVWQLTNRGIGQSTCIGIGGDPIVGSNFMDLLPLFNDDPQTKRWLSSARSAAPPKRKPQPISGPVSRSRCSALLPARPRLPEGAWATPAPLFPAARARQRKRTQHGRRPAFTWKPIRQ